MRGRRGPAAIAQFENEARPGFHGAISPSDQVNLLARQFVIMGCDSTTEVNQEWSRFLEAAYAALAGSSEPATTTNCSGYVHGVFSGKSFVEIRNHFSVNGHPFEEGALPSESIGNAVDATMGAHRNLEGRPGLGPVVELRRTLPAVKRSLRTRSIQIRFHTTMTGVLDHAGLLEGDEIYGGSISEILR